MRFTKMQGAGNDFIIIDGRSGSLTPETAPELAASLCKRRVSIGADGLMLVLEADDPQADFRMYFYNADGSLGEMCGNGARCICRYGYENGLAGKIQRVQTTAGMVTGERLTETEYRVRLNDITVMKLHQRLPIPGGEVKVHYVEMGAPGLPHAVIHIPELARTDPDSLRSLSKLLRSHAAFPKGANVDLWDVAGEDRLTAMTFERGVEDFTLACGTGAGSLVSVLTCLGLVSGKNVPVAMPGGVLRVSCDCSGDLPRSIFLTGPTRIVCTGEVLEA